MAIERRMTGSYLPLHEAMDRLFDGSFLAPQMFGGQGTLPAANVHVTDDDVVIEMAMPGVNPDDINISITGDTVTLSGEVKREKRDQKGKTYVEEIMEGHFQRSFVLPFPVDAERANATFENGILKLTLPKSESAKPRKIQVSKPRTLEGQTQRETRGDVQKETVPSQQQTTGNQKQAASTQTETASTKSGKSG